MQNQVEIYQTQDGQISLHVSFEEDTVWLTQLQMSEIFGTTPENILMHLKNIYKEGELDEIVTTKNSLVVRQEGKRSVKRKLKHYNLDAIISVGYRVNSKAGTQFRIWATTRLKEYLVQGYAINQQRLQAKGVEFNQVIQLLDRTLTNQTLINDEGKAVINVVQDYARTWSLLQAYDEQKLSAVKN